jgi:predicted metal-dependent hydrolase
MNDSPPTINVDEIIRSHRKTLSLEIQKDGRLIVRAPHQIARSQIISFVQSKETWIKKKQDLMKTQSKNIPERNFVTGEQFLFLGENYALELVKSQEKPLILKDKFYLVEKFQDNGKHIFEDWYKKQAREEITYLVKLNSQKDGFSYTKVRITSAKTRWGSCGSKGTLNFPWRLVMAPREVISYVVIHELVHLKIKNHSRTFWEEVKRLMPEYKHYQMWLKENGHRLTLG